jgi:hypothetical protein
MPPRVRSQVMKKRKEEKKKRKNGVFNFVLVLRGASEPDSRLEDALYEAGCDDAILSFRNGIAYLEFDREAGSLEKAIVSAVRDVERADAGIQVIRVEPGDLVNGPEIARRVQVTREYIRLLAQGRRGKGDFPAPQSGITGKTLVWSWAEVVGWLFQHDMLEEKFLVDMAETIRDLNDALELRENPERMSRRLKYLRELEQGKGVGHSSTLRAKTTTG